MTGRKMITRWNMLALVAGITGATATLVLSEKAMRRWSQSGQQAPIGRWTPLPLTAGEQLVYYETRGEVPVANMQLWVVDGDNQRLFTKQLMDDESYRLLTSGWSGRAMWAVTVPESGTYRVICHNHNFESPEAVPSDDRVAMEKVPQRLDDVKTKRRTIQIAGASITMLAVIGLYIAHIAALGRLETPGDRAKARGSR